MSQHRKVLVLWKKSVNIEKIGLRHILFNYLFNDHSNKKHTDYFIDIQENMLDLFTESNFDWDIQNDNDDIEHFSLNHKSIGTYQAIFILAELDWHGHSLTDFYGLTTAQKLRLNNIKCPIFICSFMPYEYLLKEEQYKILSFRGQYFIQLPEAYNEDIEILPLDELELLDCKMHYCGIEGSIREIYHKKQHILTEKNLDEAKKQFASLIEEIIQLKGLPVNVAKVAEKLKEEGKKVEKREDLLVLCKADESKLLTYLKDSEKEIVHNQLKTDIKWNWKILILEDNPNDIEPLIQTLTSISFPEENILFANTYDEAVSIINADRGNKIAVAICDYRLEQEGNVRQKQGYSFVMWLSKQDRYTEIFVYSGLSRRFLKDVFKIFNIRASVYSKYEMLNSMNGFVDEVIDKGNEIADFVTHCPTSDAWANIEQFYQQYRQGIGYDSMEREINETARNILIQIENLWETIEKYDIKEKVSLSKIPTFPNLSGDLSKVFKKSEVDENSKLLDSFLPENTKLYEIQIDKKNKKKNQVSKYYCFYSITEEKYRTYFKNKLIARRIAWWLLMCKGIHINTVYSLLTKGEFINDYFNKSQNYDEWQSSLENSTPETDKAKALIYTNLAIKREDFPYNLLIEEKNWFKYDMNFDLNDLMSIFSGFENYFNGFFETFHSKMNWDFDAYKELEDTFIININGRFKFHTANDIRKALELSIKSLENTNDKRDLIYKVISRFDENDIICKPYFDKLHKYCKTQLIALKNK